MDHHSRDSLTEPRLQQPTWLNPACLLDTWLSVCCMPCAVGEMARMTSFQEAYRTALLLVLSSTAENRMLTNQ